MDVWLRGAMSPVRAVFTVLGQGRRPFWRAALTFAAVAATLGACHPQYRPPALNEPHAMMKVRIAYHAADGPNLRQLVLINNHVADVPLPPSLPGDIARAVPVSPVATTVELRSIFFHTAITQQMVTESYSCGTGTAMRTCTRSVWRTVPVEIVHAACSRTLSTTPQAGAIYLLQYDYLGPDACTLACFREDPQPDGSFRHTPCEPAPP